MLHCNCRKLQKKWCSVISCDATDITSHRLWPWSIIIIGWRRVREKGLALVNGLWLGLALSKVFRHPREAQVAPPRWEELFGASGHDASLGRCSRHPYLGGDPGHAGETIHLSWPGNDTGWSQRSWWRWLGRGVSGLPCWNCCPVTWSF